MIVAKGLTKRFGDVLAVDNLDMDVRPGEIFGFLGPNGAGKTTTIRMLSALISPTSGKAKVAGYDVGREDNEIRRNAGNYPVAGVVRPPECGEELKLLRRIA